MDSTIQTLWTPYIYNYCFSAVPYGSTDYSDMKNEIETTVLRRMLAKSDGKLKINKTLKSLGFLARKHD